MVGTWTEQRGCRDLPSGPQSHVGKAVLEVVGRIEGL